MNFDRIKKMYEALDESQKKDFATMVGFAVLHGIGWDIRDLGTNIKMPFDEGQIKYVKTFLGHVAIKMRRP